MVRVALLLFVCGCMCVYFRMQKIHPSKDMNLPRLHMCNLSTCLPRHPTCSLYKCPPKHPIHSLYKCSPERPTHSLYKCSPKRPTRSLLTCLHKPLKLLLFASCPPRPPVPKLHQQVHNNLLWKALVVRMM